MEVHTIWNLGGHYLQQTLHGPMFVCCDFKGIWDASKYEIQVLRCNKRGTNENECVLDGGGEVENGEMEAIINKEKKMD
jgi:hypothetical protein